MKLPASQRAELPICPDWHRFLYLNSAFAETYCNPYELPSEWSCSSLWRLINLASSHSEGKEVNSGLYSQFKFATWVPLAPGN